MTTAAEYAEEAAGHAQNAKTSADNAAASAVAAADTVATLETAKTQAVDAIVTAREDALAALSSDTVTGGDFGAPVPTSDLLTDLAAIDHRARMQGASLVEILAVAAKNQFGIDVRPVTEATIEAD